MSFVSDKMYIGISLGDEIKQLKDINKEDLTYTVSDEGDVLETGEGAKIITALRDNEKDKTFVAIPYSE